jgi:beta-glucuronidase
MMKLFHNLVEPKKFIVVLIIFSATMYNKAIFSQDTGNNFPEIPPYVLPDPQFMRDIIPDPMQSRLFKTTDIRDQINLAGFWQFKTDPDERGEADSYFESILDPETQLWIPGSWNATPRYWQYQGIAWYERQFEIPRDGNLRIRFASVFYKTKVWLDGNYLGENEGAYSPFSLLAKNQKEGIHRVVVKVDNRLNDQSLPKDGVDWFPFGGIFRPVYAEIVPNLYIDNFHVIAEEISDQKASLTVKVFVENLNQNEQDKDITFYINDHEVHAAKYLLKKGSNTIEFRTLIESPSRWSPEHPNLYTGRVVLSNGEDDQYTRFGVRSFEIDGYKILLNGKRFKLMGANHHDDHPDWGSALPPNTIRTDIEILKRMRANAVRGHYPPSEMFMDFCDVYGLVFMNEVPSWQYRPEQLANPVVKEKIKKQYFDMVYRDMNHPAIITWSLGNEWREFEKSYNDIKELVDYARTVDQTHFITFIAGGAHVDRSYKLIDIICTNWSKYQWYWNPTYNSDSLDNQPKSTLLSENVAKESIRRLNKIHEIYPDKPVILTEFGGSGSQAGWHNWANVKWSEEYQARNVWDSGLYGLDQDWISGGCVWQFCDTRTTPYRMLGSRLRGWNVKGVVDEYRQPKMAFYKLQDLFSRFNSFIVPSE